MSALTDQIDNQNFLSPVGFKFQIKKTPKTNYFVQAVNIPSVVVGEAAMPTPFVNIPVPGDHLTFGNLSVQFKVDEDMVNYLELYNWIRGIGFPESFQERKDAEAENLAQRGVSGELYSDGVLMVLTSNMNSNVEINFKDMYPVSLSDVQFDVQQADIDYVTATVDFRFRQFDITKL